uniref:Uncharacterized protein n=1 Tax=Ciona savignyi TaxID=51511 RepID=H2Y9D2_CIOSA
MLRQGTSTTGKLTIAKQVADMKEQTEYMKSYRQALGSALNEVQALKSELGRQKSISKKSLVSDVSKTTIGEKNSHVVAEMTQVTVSASSTLDRIKAKVEYKSKMYSTLTGQLRAFAKALTRRDKKLAEKIELNKELNARVRELESARMTTDNELAICRNRLMQSEKLLITREREIFYQGKEISRLDRYVWELSGRLGQLESQIDQYKHFDRNWNVSAQGSYARPAVASAETAEQYSMHRSMPAAASPRSNTHRPHSYTRNNRYHANT